MAIDRLRLETYLVDLGRLLKNAAREVKKQYLEASADDERNFCAGRLLAYNEVISLMQQQAVVFGLSFEAVNLADIDPDSELVG